MPSARRPPLRLIARQGRPRVGVLALLARHPDPGPVPIRSPAGWQAGTRIPITYVLRLPVRIMAEAKLAEFDEGATSTFSLHAGGFRVVRPRCEKVGDNHGWTNG